VDARNPAVREVLRQVAPFEPELRTSFPFPKTRHVVFQKSLPSSLPGWVQLDLFT